MFTFRKQNQKMKLGALKRVIIQVLSLCFKSQKVKESKAICDFVSMTADLQILRSGSTQAQVCNT